MRRLAVLLLVAAVALGAAAPAFATGRRIVCYSASATTFCPFWGESYSGMRFQTNVEQSRIRYAGQITEVEFYNYSTTSARFNNYIVHLCHTDRDSLSPIFGVNYYGTPVQVVSLSAYTIPAARGWFGLRMNRRFTYDNVRNLLIEIRWEGDSNVNLPIYMSDQVTGNRRIWAVNNPNAYSGIGDSCAYYLRLNFGIFTGAAPTSLGRVKAMFD
jgi:hypothetical protein